MARPAKAAVFLDRDGVLNKAIIRSGKPYPPRDLGEFAIIADARASLDALKSEGFLLVVVTNQPDVARGRVSRAEVDAINAKLAGDLPLDTIEVCEHDDNEHCDCRKPKPGMMKMIAERFEVDPEHTPVVGDSLRDLQAGLALGFQPHLVLTGKGKKTLAAGGLPPGTKVHDDLRAFALDFLSHEHE